MKKLLFLILLIFKTSSVYAFDNRVVKYCAMLRDDEHAIYLLQWTIDARSKLLDRIKTLSSVRSKKEIDGIQKMIDDSYDTEVKKAWKIDAELNKNPNNPFPNAAADHALLVRSAMINVLNDGLTLTNARDSMYRDCLAKIVTNPR